MNKNKLFFIFFIKINTKNKPEMDMSNFNPEMLQQLMAMFGGGNLPGGGGFESNSVKSTLTNIHSSINKKNQGFLDTYKNTTGLFNTISNFFSSLLKWNTEKSLKRNILPFWPKFFEEVWIDISVKNMFMIFSEILESYSIGSNQSEIYRVITPDIYMYKHVVNNEKEEEHLKKVRTLLLMSKINTKKKEKIYNKSSPIIYMYGDPGTGKTTTILQDLMKQDYTVYYFNISNIFFSKDSNLSITSNIIEAFRQIRNLSSEGKKVAVIFDDCENLLKNITNLDEKINKTTDEKDKNIEQHISKEMWKNERSLTSLLLALTTYRDFPLFFISNSHDTLPDAMSRRINYFWYFDGPDLISYLNMWKELLKIYYISFYEEDNEDIIYFLAEKSKEYGLSIRDIKLFVISYRNRRIYIKELLNFIKSKKDNQKKYLKR